MYRVLSRFVLSAAAPVLFWHSTALANPSQDECMAAFEKAQVDRSEGRYMSAIENARLCSQPQCSSVISTECSRMHETFLGEVPTVIPSAKDVNGRDLLDVRVIIDGNVATEKLNGVPLRLDPGVHQFRFEAEGLPPKEMTHRAIVGDRNRLVEVMLGEKPVEEQPAAATTLALPEPVAPAPEKKGIPVASYVLGGVGVLALGGFTYLRLSGINDYNGLDRSCSPRCDPDEVDSIRQKFTFSYVALGVGAAALTTSAIVFVVSRNKTDETPVAEVGMAPVPAGAAARFTARF